MPQLTVREPRPAGRRAGRLRGRTEPDRGAAVATPAGGRSIVGGTVLLPFGRYFAPQADLLTREGFKTVVPIEGVSPFSAMGEPDPEMQRFADGERVNERARTEVRKDLAARLAATDADYLVVDNTPALLFHREVNGRLYTVLAGEDTDLMDSLWNSDPDAARAEAFKASHDGLTERLMSAYDGFVRACLDSFDPAHIILVRSHAARFWVADDGTIAPTDVDRRDARLLEKLDDLFLSATGCLVADGALGHFPSTVSWKSPDHRLRQVLEDDLVRLCSVPHRDDGPGPAGADAVRYPSGQVSAADHVVGAVRRNRPVDRVWLRGHFAAGGASYDDLVALAYLDQQGGAGGLVRACVRHALDDPASYPLAVTRRRFERSLRALRGWPWGPLSGLRGWREGSLRRSLRGWRWGALPAVPEPRLAWVTRSSLLRALRGWWWGALRRPAGDLWTPQIAVTCAAVALRFLDDGSVRRVPLSGVAASDADAVVAGRVPVTPHNLHDVLGSWPVYLERGRRTADAAPRLVVADVADLVSTCSWVDWATVLEHERVVITTPHPATVPAHGPSAKTDLSFLFDPRTRIGTVGGGLMDQVTHIALFDQVCTPHGLVYYLDDLRYTWWRSHNGFEASRLAPGLERRRITRLVSQPLVEAFRATMGKTRLPWVYNQSRTWYELGLHDATVVTKDHPNARRLMETGPEFPVRVYTENDELGPLIQEPPSRVGFFTTQQRIAVRPESAAALRRVFSYRHLTAAGLDPEVARTADLLRGTRHVALHIRRGDYINPHFDTGGWHSSQSHYIEAIRYLVEEELGTSDVDVAVFSDDLEFVEAHAADYGLDRVTGTVRFIRGNSHYKSIYDSYLMSLCPVIVGSVGSFAATTSLLAEPPSVFIRARPGGVQVEWRR